MMNTIYVRRSRKLVIERGNAALPARYLATALKNIESLGFTFSQQLQEALGTLSVEAFTAFYRQLTADLKQLVGAHVRFKPMYPDFPEQVMEFGDAELYLNAVIHYLTLVLPDQALKERIPLLDKTKLKVIDHGSEEHFRQMIRNLVAAKTSLSATDKEDVEWAIAHLDEVGEILPDVIPLKENVGFVAALLLKYDKAAPELVGRYIGTATDVLRLATALSDGDVSLAANTKFRKFKRAERRLLLELLESCGSITEDMLRYRNRWIRLGEILHPAEYKLRYAKCREAFDILRNGKTFETFNGTVELALRYGDTRLAAETLADRPGEYARRLDHLLRAGGDSAYIIDGFRRVAGRVSTPVLLQVMTHFRHRNEPLALRTFFPKGNVAKTMAIPNTLPELPEEICEQVVQICQNALIDRFSVMPKLGGVYIDERLKQYNVPFSRRSASKALRTIVRGSRLPMPEGDTIRFFLWWKEGLVNGKETGRVDIDLSAVIYDGSWGYMEHISYTNLRSHAYKAVHSGDITSAPNGACEFIDIDIPSVLGYGGRYVLTSLNAFTEQPFCNLPECFAGWMMRKHPGSGEIFEPSTVADKVDLAADTQIAIPVILDLEERTVIWCDLALTRHPQLSNNIEGNERGMLLLGQAMTSLRKPNLYDLFMLHAAARGELSEQADAAQTVFSVEEGITPFDTDRLMSEFLV